MSIDSTSLNLTSFSIQSSYLYFINILEQTNSPKFRVFGGTMRL